MVTVEKVESREELREAMGNILDLTRSLARQGHEDTHKSCDPCERFGLLHAELSKLITSWHEAPA